MPDRLNYKSSTARSFTYSFLRGIFYLTLVVLGSLTIFSLFVPGTFDPQQFMPHGHCYLYKPGMIWLHTISDTIIGTSYVCISGTLAYLVFKRNQNVPFHWLFLAFGLFIISCGLTHFMEIVNIWNGLYWLAGYVKLVTALASLATAIVLVLIFPKILSMIDTLQASEDRRLKLIEANRELESFASSVAHDLRAPLRTMRGFAQVLNQDFVQSLPVVARAHTDKIMSAAQKMDDLIQDLLKYSKVNLSELVIEEVNLNSAIEEVISSLDSNIQERQAEIKLQGTFPVIFSNRAFLNQIFSNLLTNALKFVPANVVPKITISGKSTDETVRISLADNGIGIAPEYQEKIFKMFERLSAEEQYTGTGIGLAIVKRAVDRLGGKVGVDSASDKGSTFWVEFPNS